MKKVISLILVLVMTAALFCTPAFAATYGSKSHVEDVDVGDYLIFWDYHDIYDKYLDLENRKIVAYTDEDLAAVLENTLADIAAKKEAGKATDEELATAEFLADVKPENLKPLFVKHFRWSNPLRKDAITFDMDFEGTEESKLIMIYRDWNDLHKTATEEQKTLWKLADASMGPTVGVEAVNKGTVAVLVVTAD